MNYFTFENLGNIDDVAEALSCGRSLIEFILDYPCNFYHQLLIPRKRRKKPRIVYEVADNLKSIHKGLLVSIAAKANFPEYVQGFVSKRSIVTNASLHLAQSCILNLDIKDFFESIKIEKISTVFEELGCNDEVSIILARLCTFNERLVQGANTSPILANLACAELDKDLLALGEEYGCLYSRYADDITFSGEKVPKKRSIDRYIRKYEFRLNPDKWKYQRRGKAQYVTGLTVFDGIMPRIPKKIKRQLRQKLYYIDKYGLTEQFNRIGIKDADEMGFQIAKIDGLIAFIYSVEPKYAYQFDMLWQKILIKEGVEQSRDPFKLFRKWENQRSLNHSAPVQQPTQTY